MSCTTILVGKNATYDGSTMIARNDDSGSGHFTPKKWVAVAPNAQPQHYKSVIKGLEIELPEHPLRYTAVPNAVEGEGIWAASGINEMNVAMTATETITTNARVLGADPLVDKGIGEEDLVTLTLPYIHTAREGVERLGGLLEQYGTYESNGIAFSDGNEIWWLETIGGHHWIAKRVPDNVYVVMPNQLGIDSFELGDALGARAEHMCSADLAEFIGKNHLNLSFDNSLNPRDAFGSHDDSDHVYNTPRAWFMERYFNPGTIRWDGPGADYRPESDNIPWSMIPEKKITPEDVKYVLSAHFQGTPFDPYASYGKADLRGAYRSIGINRNDFMALLQIRPDGAEESRAIMWLAFGSNAFNTMAPFYANVDTTPEYLANTTARVSTENFYWSSRLLGALADAHYGTCLAAIERYQEKTAAMGHEMIHKYDKKLADYQPDEATLADVGGNPDETHEIVGVTNAKTLIRAEANAEIADRLKKLTDEALDKVLFAASNGMKNGYVRNDPGK